MKKISFITTILSIIIVACSMGTGSNKPVVYVGGSYMEDSQERACYWVDGVRHELDGYSVMNITASGGKVYTAGCYKEGETFKACYWINHSRYDLPGCKSTGDYDFGNISIDSGNVYIVGMYGDQCCYWVNGVREVPPADGIINDAYAANGSVYLSGYSIDGEISKAYYWKNGIRCELASNVTFNPAVTSTRISSTIIVVNNKVYAAASFYPLDTTTDDYYTIIWTNSVQQLKIDERIIALAVSGGDIYVDAQSGYYKNGQPYQPEKPNPVDAHFNTMISVSQGKIYVANSDGDSACYWVDGVCHDLDGYSAKAIFIAEY